MTYGVLGANMEGREEAFAVTLEHPWRENKPNVSRIPPGKYKATIYASPNRKGALVILLWNVPGRKDIEIHIGNVPADTLGCILAGESFDWVYPKSKPKERGILSSKAAMAELLAYLKGEPEIIVEIKDKF